MLVEWSWMLDSLMVVLTKALPFQGHLRKDFNWAPPNKPSSGQAGGGSDGEKHKRRRQKKGAKNTKPSLTIGLPTFGMNGSQVMWEDNRN